MEKVVQLQRGEREGENPGSFGFSVFGGAGARLPAAVCEVTPGGPADQSGQVRACVHTCCGESRMSLVKISMLVSAHSTAAPLECFRF